MDSLKQTAAEILPLPAHTDPTDHDIAHKIEDNPTLSHELAMTEQEEKGAAQIDHDEDVVDLGWNEKPRDIVNPLVGGLSNEDLWVLVRRFNKQTYHFKEITAPVAGGLDLNIAEEEEFSPDKLRSNIERLYMTVIVGLLGFVKHIARIRSWRETRRTSAFCAAYTVAWAFDLIIPLLSATLIALIISPKARILLFPPAPLALVDSKTGGVQKPKSGVLASHDSITGAPENHKGEAVEQEASNFVTGIGAIALSSTIGKHPQGAVDPKDADSTPQDSFVPDPTALASSAAISQEKAAGDGDPHKKDKTRVPLESAMWSKMRPVMHGLSEVTDNWERVANALSPTAPFPKNAYRLRLAALILPLFLGSFFVTPYMLVKGISAGIGFGFFGDPIIQRGLGLLNRKFPHWMKILEVRNTILKGVPTNNQLALTLLRIGEANRAPLPPPPHTTDAPPDKPAAITDEHLRSTGADPPLNATPAELDAAITHDPLTKHEISGHDVEQSKAAKHGKFGSRILGFFKGTTRAAVQTAIGADSLKAKTGSLPAKNRLGVVPPKKGYFPEDGPVEFEARWKGKKGMVHLTAGEVLPDVIFVRGEGKAPEWRVPVGQIAEMRKIGGYSWKVKALVGWSMEREVADGLEIIDRKGDKFIITACALRDELFNRLCAMGGQKWEAW